MTKEQTAADLAGRIVRRLTGESRDTLAGPGSPPDADTIGRLGAVLFGPADPQVAALRANGGGPVSRWGLLGLIADALPLLNDDGIVSAEVDEDDTLTVEVTRDTTGAPTYFILRPDGFDAETVGVNRDERKWERP